MHRKLATVLTSLSLAGGLSAGVLNLDWNHSSGPTYIGLGAASDTATNTYWNGARFDETNLTYSDGTTTSTVSVDVADVGRSWSDSDGPQASGNAAADLMTDYWYGNNSTISVTIDGLDDNITYDIYHYGAGNGTDQTVSVTLDTVTKSTTTVDASTTSLVNGEDYVLFSGVQAVNGIISYDVVGNGTNTAVGNGLQIVENPTNVPEPSAIMLLIPGIGLLLRRKRS